MIQNSLTLIMAQGRATRWGNGRYKHLAAFNGVPMLTRVCKQVQAYGTDATVIGWAEYAAHTAGLRLVSVDSPGDDVCHGIRDTAYLWGSYQRIIILLGDVVYSESALKAIYADTAPLRFYGRICPSTVTGKTTDERYALSLDRRAGVFLLGAVGSVITDTDCIPALKSLYQDVIGCPHHYRDRKPMVYWEDNILMEINDYTDDFDQYEEYLDARDAVEAEICRAEQEPMSQ